MGAEPDAGHAALMGLAFRRWGRNLQAHVFGEYAAVVSPGEAGRALATHDALGMMPLFCTACEGELVVATRLADLAPYGGGAGLDYAYLGQWLATGEYQNYQTPFLGVRRLLPGESWEWAGGRLWTGRTWSPSITGSPPQADDAKELTERLEAAVCALAGDKGPAWAELSGGLDSSTVVSIAARSQVQGLEAVSVVYSPWPESDERRWMEAVVERCGIPWHVLDAGSLLPFSAAPAAFLGEPATALLDEALLSALDQLLGAHGVARLLTGQGGDELFVAGGAPGHLADRLVEGHPARAIREMGAWRDRSWGSRSWSFWVINSLLAPVFRHIAGQSQRARSRGLPPWIDEGFAREHHLGRLAHRRLGPTRDSPGRQVLWESLWALALNGSALRQRGAGYEIGHPLADVRLVEWVAGLPWERRVKPGEDRWLQRRAMEGIWPPLVQRRRGKGVTTPAIAAGLQQNPEWVQLLTDDPVAARFGLIDATAWREAVQKARAGCLESDRHFLATASLEVWLQQLGVQRSRLKADPGAEARA